MTDYEKLYAAQAGVCGEPFPEFVRMFHALPQGQTVLDLGCGQGRDALVAARRGHRVVGVDLSPSGVDQMVAQAELEGLDVTGVVANLVEFEPKEGFDVVVLDRVLHMLPDDATRRSVLSRMAEAVNPGGHLLVADTPKNLPVIQGVMDGLGDAWEPVLARKGFRFWRRSDAPQQADP